MKRVGIIGGMGPLATADLFQKIIERTDARSDDEHIHLLIDCNTSIPDRTRAILEGGPSPLAELVRSALGLEGMGAELLAMPCNTAHFFYGELLAFVRVPVLNMIGETLEEVRRSGIKKAGLLATEGTCRSGIYQEMFGGSGIELLLPEGEGQAEVTRVIYRGVKSGAAEYDVSVLNRTLDRLAERGAETLILGCTELPIAFSRYGLDRRTIDPTAILASAVVREAML